MNVTKGNEYPRGMTLKRSMWAAGNLVEIQAEIQVKIHGEMQVLSSPMPKRAVSSGQLWGDSLLSASCRLKVVSTLFCFNILRLRTLSQGFHFV